MGAAESRDHTSTDHNPKALKMRKLGSLSSSESFGPGSKVLQNTKVVGYGAFGENCKGERVAPELDAETVFVDATELRCVQEGPFGAEGRQREMYHWLGLGTANDDPRIPSAFPDPVRHAITGPLLAKCHAYGAEGQKKCVHVAGPDFRSMEVSSYAYREVRDQLARAYCNVFAEFCTSGARVLRLLPIGEGTLSDAWAKYLPDITAAAVERGYEQLNTEQQQQLLQSRLEMCIFEPENSTLSNDNADNVTKEGATGKEREGSKKLEEFQKAFYYRATFGIRLYKV